MRIAQLAPLWETVPPRSYGGTELVVHLLTEELVKQGHEVVLFAAKASQTSAKLEVCSHYPLRELWEKHPEYIMDEQISMYPGSPLSIFSELRLLEKVFSQANCFDVIHNHLGFVTLPFANLVETPVVTTLHGAFQARNLYECREQKYFEEYSNLPFVSISDYQRRPCPQLNYVGTVYHGLDVKRYEPSFTYSDKGYLAFLGRFCKDKGPHHAIKVAKETGWRLIMAGKVDCADEKEFFQNEIVPHIDNDQIQYIGELNHRQKVDLLQGAAATLCPVTWPEPFGLVLIESMACGTPVIALRNGSIPEIIRHGETGFVMDTVEELTQVMGNIGEIDRRVCRHHVESHFSMQQMTNEYLEIYKTLSDGSKKQYRFSHSQKEVFSPNTDCNMTVLPSPNQAAIH